MHRNLKVGLQIGLVVIVLGLIIIPKTSLFKEQSPSNVNPTNSRGLPVTAVVLAPEVMENVIRSAGSLVASEAVDVTTEISGLVKSIHFNEGGDVKKGDLLVSINDDEMQAQREKAIHQRQLISQTLERHRILLEKEAISREDFDKVQTDWLVVESEIKLLDTRIKKMSIRAPFDGTIGFRDISPGAYLQPGMRIARLVKSSPLRIEFSLPERYLSASLIGQTIFFNVAGFTQAFEAKVYAIEPAVNASTRSVILRAVFSNNDSKLLPGMFADIRIITSSENDIVQVPSQAIIPQMDGELVFVSRNGVAHQQRIETGVRTERNVAVTSGLVVGDTVITSGILQLRSGMPVNITNLR